MVPARPNSSKARVPPIRTARDVHDESKDEFDDDDLDDNDLVNVGTVDNGFQDIDDIDLSQQDHISAPTKRTLPKVANKAHASRDDVEEDVEPRRLPNGNWECAHKCKDRQKCKHLCCKEGTGSKPKSKKPKMNDSLQPSSSHSKEKTQSKLQLSRSEPQPLPHRPKPSTVSSCSSVYHPRLEDAAISSSSNKMPEPVSALNKLRDSVRKGASFRQKQLAESDYTYRNGTQPTLSFLDKNTVNEPEAEPEPEPEPTTNGFDEVDVSMDEFIDDDLAMTDSNEDSTELETPGLQITGPVANVDDDYDAPAEEDDLLEDALIGAEDSYRLSSNVATPAQGPLQVERLDVAPNRGGGEPESREQSYVMRVSASNTMASAHRAKPAQDMNDKVSLFVHDSSSIPARHDTGRTTEMSAKRTLDAVLEPGSEPAEQNGIVNKKARMDLTDNVADIAPPEEFGRIKPQDITGGAVVTRGGGVKKASEEDALRQWLLQEFGDSVELV